MASSARRILTTMGIALLLRVLLPFASIIAVGNEGVFLFPDSPGYINPTEELLRSGRFANGDLPEITRTPGYPVLLMPGIALGKPVLVTIALQVILSLLTVWFVHRITALIFENENAAVAAALLYSLEPLSILYTTLILSETLFAALVAAFFFCLADYFKRKQAMSSLILAALALSASIYVRPVSYYLPILVSLVLLPALLVRFKKPKYVLHVAVFFLVSIGAVAAWQIRNKVRADYPGFSAVSDFNLYLYQGGAAVARAEGLPFEEVQRRLRSFEGHPEHTSWTEAQEYAFMRREGVKMILAHPLAYAAIHVRGMAGILFDPGSVDYLKIFLAYPRLGGMLSNIANQGLIKIVLGLIRSNPLVFWTQLAFFALLAVYYLLSLIGLSSRTCAGLWEKIALVAIIAYFVAVSGGPHSYGRFRHPAMPLFCVLAGCGWHTLTRRIDRHAAIRDSKHLNGQR